MAFSMILTGCFGGRAASSSGRGGEVVGIGGRSFVEPTPYGMVKVNRGFLKMDIPDITHIQKYCTIQIPPNSWSIFQIGNKLYVTRLVYI